MLQKLACMRLSHHAETAAILSILYGLPAIQINKVQRVLNAAPRLVDRAPRHCHVTPLLRELHWLPVRQRIHYKSLLFTFKTIHGKSPVYLQLRVNFT